MPTLALYQPDIPQNTASMMRMCACLGVNLDIIEPCGFSLDDKRMQRVGMDYMQQVKLTRHINWEAFIAAKLPQQRVIVLSTKAEDVYTDFQYQADDILLMGRESAGVPESVVQQADMALRIPMQPEARSLNVAMAAAMVLGEALRQNNV